MIKPVLQDEAFLADVRAASQDSKHFHLWWLGQSGFLVHYNDQYLVMDPYLSHTTKDAWAGGGMPHVIMTQRVIAPRSLNFVHVITSSHNHSDHLDGQTIQPMLWDNDRVRLIVPEANRTLAADRLRVSTTWPIGLDDAQSVTVGVFHFTAIAAAHETIERDAKGRCLCLGYIVQFGPWTIYHSGDTVVYEQMGEKLRAFKIDVALLPINGRGRPGIVGNMTGPEAAKLAHDIGAKLVIPCHYEMFANNTESPNAFVAAANKLAQPYRLLKAGQRWSSQELREDR
jgi:L-ascorbate metabolism protein UlaG (beta-lactamase superfamily)